MPAFEPQDPHFEARVHASFARQAAMTTIGASVIRVSPGEVEIELPFRTTSPSSTGSSMGASSQPSRTAPAAMLR